MDYRLISVSNFDADVNIGDYIQALASSQFCHVSMDLSTVNLSQVGKPNRLLS